jgi:hypothetical protein
VSKVAAPRIEAVVTVSARSLTHRSHLPNSFETSHSMVASISSPSAWCSTSALAVRARTMVATTR